MVPVDAVVVPDDAIVISADALVVPDDAVVVLPPGDSVIGTVPSSFVAEGKHADIMLNKLISRSSLYSMIQEENESMNDYLDVDLRPRTLDYTFQKLKIWLFNNFKKLHMHTATGTDDLPGDIGAQIRT